MGNAAAKAEIELRKLGWNAEPEHETQHLYAPGIAAAHKSFNKFKLIRGLTALYLVPEISRFVELYRNQYLEEHND